MIRRIQKMDIEDLFFMIFLLTLVAIRLFLFMWPISSPIVLDFHLHHFMYGLLLMVASLVFRNKYVAIGFFAVGLGFFIDEVPMFFSKDHWNWAIYDGLRYRLALVPLIMAIYAYREGLLERVHSKKLQEQRF